ncbi:agmatinase [Hyphobacterium sp.]|uniref:agmatinase n=1 Tax=Hyphobacterium sp. TaxID=2004662 RepID=UPI003BAD2AED
MTDRLSLEDGFLGLEEQLAPADAPLVRVIPFGLEASVTFGGGTSKGPAAMIAASHEVELFDETLWREPVEAFRVETLVEPSIPAKVEPALDMLASLTDEALKEGAFPIVLGGEHSITPGAIRPFLERYPDLILLHFDAHADLRDGYEGEHYSHAAAIRRCLDAPDLEVVSLGIRNISKEEIPFLEANRHRVHIHWAKDKRNWSLDEIIAPLKDRPIYVTFDVDGLDASLMPATGTPEPGGLFWDDVIPVLEAATKVGKFVGADVNELAPIEGFHGPNFIAAKLAYKIMSLAHCRD